MEVTMTDDDRDGGDDIVRGCVRMAERWGRGGVDVVAVAVVGSWYDDVDRKNTKLGREEYRSIEYFLPIDNLFINYMLRVNYVYIVTDLEGNVPIWEAMMADHEPVVKILADNGATISSGDVGQFSCTATEQNNLELLKKILYHGGDVTLPKSNGSTALHVAVCEGNTEIVKFLLDQGTNIDKPDIHGWTPRDLADQQGHEDIKTLFQSHKAVKTQYFVVIPEQKRENKVSGRFTSEPTIYPMSRDGSSGGVTEWTWRQSQPRRRTSNFHNSLFGIMSAANGGNNNDLLSSIDQTKCAETDRDCPIRVTVSCLEKGDVKGKLVLLPQSFQELLEIGAKKFCLLASKVLTKDGAEIDDIELIRDGDHLVFVSAGEMGEPNCQNGGVLS
ncbi:potassium channel AKT1-like [Camellia sinensis]|uniref:potassium channel AKT1-like n=1 Tax=Camellia sinensis TaxID=4442 RepID=UPI001035A1F2|nr:potassium channel AKT1-like [Camellia sinensis]